VAAVAGDLTPVVLTSRAAPTSRAALLEVVADIAAVAAGMARESRLA
jgi:hypothetical protein